jgi:hypothetical protein
VDDKALHHTSTEEPQYEIKSDKTDHVAYTLSQAFHSGLARLRALGHERRCAIMCAEAVGRDAIGASIVDYLIAAGESVFYILGPDRIEQARMTNSAPRADALLTYR